MTVQITDKRGKNKPIMARKPDKHADIPPWFPVFKEFEAERLRQLAKWGDQSDGSRQDGTGYSFFVDWANEYKRQNDEREAAGKKGIWAKILLEEIFEALSETDPARLEHELIQAGAVITGWIEDLRYRRGAIT